MKAISKVLVGAALVLGSAGAFAAKPTSVKYVEDVVVGDALYSHYVVNCSNGVNVDVSAWDNRKSWCMGKGGKDDCAKKQIKIAKKACKGA